MEMKQPWWSRQWVHTAVVVVIAVLLGQGVRLWGLAWLVIAMSILVAFLLGWAAARRTWRKRGYVPKI